MVLNLSLSPDAEARLRERAQASGVSPEEFARRVVEEAVRPGSANDTPPTVPEEASSAEVQKRLASLRKWMGTVTGPGPADDSRESIYGGEGRGE